MSTIDTKDVEATGSFLSKDQQQRLTKLLEHVVSLTHLVRTRMLDAQQEGDAEPRAGELAIGLDLLEAQITRVLDELSRLTESASPEAPESESMEADAPDDAQESADDDGNRYAAGVTLLQIDAIDRLIDKIRAHGDVVIAGDEADFVNGTLSVIGSAIFDDAQTLREIISDVGTQSLESTPSKRSGVREGQAIYLAPPLRSPLSGPAFRHECPPTYQ